MAEFLTEGECHICHDSVEFKVDKNGKIYYACGGCQTRMFMGRKPSEALKSTIVKGEPKNEIVQPRNKEPAKPVAGDAGKPIIGKPDADSAGKPARKSGDIFGF